MDKVRLQRRLSAIMAADIVGYSRLTEIDEAATLVALKALRSETIDPLLDSYQGRIVKLMGDGAIAEFGSVVDAVTCAVAFQKETAAQQVDVPPDRRIVFRIGIILATSLSTVTTCSGTGSTSQRAWSNFAIPAACSSQAQLTTRCRASSTCLWSSSATRRSRTSPGPCAPIVFAWVATAAAFACMPDASAPGSFPPRPRLSCL